MDNNIDANSDTLVTDKMAQGVDYSKFKVVELKEILASNDLPTTGNKVSLIQRLQQSENISVDVKQYQNAHPDDDVNPSDSVSRHGSRTSASSVRSARTIAAAKQASLTAKLMSMDKLQSLRVSEAKLRHEMEVHELQAELEAAYAEEKVLSAHEESMPNLTSHQDDRNMSILNAAQTHSPATESTTPPVQAPLLENATLPKPNAVEQGTSPPQIVRSKVPPASTQEAVVSQSDFPHSGSGRTFIYSNALSTSEHMAHQQASSVSVQTPIMTLNTENTDKMGMRTSSIAISQKPTLQNTHEQASFDQQMHPIVNSTPNVSSSQYVTIAPQGFKTTLPRSVMSHVPMNSASHVAFDNAPTQSAGHIAHPNVPNVSAMHNSTINYNDASQHTSSNATDAFQPNTSALLAAVSETIHLPKPELLTFCGNSKDYVKFIRNFEVNLASRVSDYGVKLSYLIQFCSGEPRRLIEDCVLLNPLEGYNRARYLLAQRYGTPHNISRSYIDSLTKGPPLKAHDLQAMFDLSQEMQKCELTLTELGYHSDINSSETLLAIVRRLPKRVRVKWVENAAAILRSQREPNFSDLSFFLQTNANVWSSVYGQELAKEFKANTHSHASGRKRNSSTSNARVTTLATQSSNTQSSSQSKSNSAVDSSVGSNQGNLRRGCVMCDRNHFIAKCPEFSEKSMDYKRDFIRKKRMCFNCLRIGHTARGCLAKSQCTQCTGKHHDLVHYDRQEQSDTDVKQVHDESKNVHCLSSRRKVCLRILPVCVCANNRSVQTYALLDQGSDVSLCDSSLPKRLGLTGEPAAFSITTVNQTSAPTVGKEVSLTVLSLENNASVQLDKVWSVDKLEIALTSLPHNEVLRKWPHLSGVNIPEIDADEVSLLIGSDFPEVFWSIEERRGNRDEPYAIKSILGWTVLGPINNETTSPASVNFQQADVLQQQVKLMWRTDFNDSLSDPRKEMSIEDKKALQIMKSTVTKRDGKFEVALPWKSKTLPNNKVVAEMRLKYLKQKLQKDSALHAAYTETINSYIEHGYATRIEPPISNDAWYLPHHPVFNPNKPNKTRVVFDCAARYKGTSLNEQLLQGPDLMNNLVGVLTRFRQERIAIVADIECMFHQVKVPRDDYNYLRFLWWPNGNLDAHPEEYCMTVHLFGATSSPSCTSFCLRKVATDHKEEFSQDAINSVERNFYVDDYLKSVASSYQGIELVQELRDLMAKGGFHLTKWLSNNREILASLPEKEKASSVTDIDINEQLPFEKALGLRWNVETDSFTFNINCKTKPATRRGVLSMTSSLYDPLGFIAPVTLIPKMMLQDCCRLGLKWDDSIPEADEKKWEQWLHTLPDLAAFAVDRCLKPQGLSDTFTSELHHFADGSEKAYGAVSYLKIYDVNGNIKVSFLMGKARLAPMKNITIPRMELAAAVVAVRLHQMIIAELDLKIDKFFFWTDSMSTLQSIRNQATRFKTFVANRLSIIHDVTNSEDWYYIPSELNPADIASRGMQPNESDKLNFWLKGPEFLHMVGDSGHPVQPENLPRDFIMNNEVKVTSCHIASQDSIMDSIINYHSSWIKLKLSVAWLLRFKKYCCKKFLKRDVPLSTSCMSKTEMTHAEHEILTYVQRQTFAKELKVLQRNNTKNTTSKPLRGSRLLKLNPLLEDGLIKVGGRLEHATSEAAKHPIILPEKHHVTELIIRNCHQQNGHVGRQAALAFLRRDYWITRGMLAVKRVIGKCFQCKRLFQNPSKQLMAPLPEERLTPDKPPFTYVGIDYFGPMFVKVGRSQHKRYGCIFTCLTTRAVHIEVAHSLDTNSFIGALHRFISRRGKPDKIFSDNGTNFTSGEKELRAALDDWNQHKINREMIQNNISWHFNPPLASHMGGIWERLVKAVKTILKSLIREQLLSDESLLTFLSEVEKILNDRPITPLTDDVNDQPPLTPNQLLLQRPNACLPQGVFDKGESYNKRWWKQAQYLANIFWRRWIREYLPTLQMRSKWCHVERNISTGDLVLLVDENSPRGKWPLGLVVGVNIGRDNLVRSVKLRVGHSFKVRPITKLCLLEQAN